MLAHKHRRGLEALVGAHLFTTLIVILAQHRLKEHPKEERKRNNKIDKGHTLARIVLLCKRCAGVTGMYIPVLGTSNEI